MNKEIDDICKRLEEYCKKHFRYDEELFNLGIELGRLLEKNKITKFRPTVFVDFENKMNAYDILGKEFNRIESVIEFLLHMSIKRHIEKNGEFEFSKGITCDKFDEENVSKFCLQLRKVTQQEYGGSFEAEFELTNDVLDLLKKYGINEYVRCDIENTTGDEYETIYDADNVKHIVFGVSLHINRHDESWDIEKLREIADKLEAKQVWLALQGNN